MAEFNWQSPGDSEPKSFPLIHMIQPSFNILLSSYTDGLDAAVFCWTKHWRTCLPLWQLHWALGLCLKVSQCLSSLLEGILAGGKCSDHGLLKLNMRCADQSGNLLCETRIRLLHSVYRTPNTRRHWNMNYRSRTKEMIQLWISLLSCI